MFVLAAMLLAAPALAEDEKYVFEAELIHAPVPLYTFDWKQVWPRGMVPDADTIAGCASRVAFGDWRFTPNLEDEYADPWWLRVSNYGVFHCAANLLEADEREELGEGEFSRGLFAMIGEGSTDGRAWELWVLQKGFVPGSAYVLLAREAEGAILCGASPSCNAAARAEACARRAGWMSGPLAIALSKAGRNCSRSPSGCCAKSRSAHSNGSRIQTKKGRTPRHPTLPIDSAF